MEGKEPTTELQTDDKTTVLTEEVVRFGKVSLLFYISDTCKNKEMLTQTIKEHGGNIAIFHECFTYQIADPEDTKDEDFEEHYYRGTIYSSAWILDSIKEK